MKMKIQLIKDLLDAAKTELKGKFFALNALIRKERSKVII